MATDIFVANQAAAVNLDGVEIILKKDVTRVRAGHPLLRKYPTLFEPILVQYDVEQATSRPGEQRGAPTPPPAPAAPAAPTPEPDPEPVAPEPEKKPDHETKAATRAAAKAADGK